MDKTTSQVSTPNGIRTIIRIGEVRGNNDPQKAKSHFQSAYALAKTQHDKHTIKNKIDSI